MSVTIVQLPPITRRPKTTSTTTPGSFGGVRIADMPDLGAVDDTSSVVGERAGSGRFAATALRDYVAASLVDMQGLTTVRQFGAKGDGTTDDATAVAAGFRRHGLQLRPLAFPPGNYFLGSAVTAIGCFAVFAPWRHAVRKQNLLAQRSNTRLRTRLA